MKFLYPARPDQCYLAHTLTGTAVPRKNFNCENEISGLQFSLLDSITSRLVGVSSRNFFSRRAAL